MRYSAKTGFWPQPLLGAVTGCIQISSIDTFPNHHHIHAVRHMTSPAGVRGRPGSKVETRSASTAALPVGSPPSASPIASDS